MTFYLTRPARSEDAPEQNAVARMSILGAETECCALGDDVLNDPLFCKPLK